MRDFAPIAPINYSDLVLVAKAALPQSTLPDLIKAAKAKPGGMSYASSGPGTPYHMQSLPLAQSIYICPMVFDSKLHGETQNAAFGSRFLGPRTK